MFKRNQFELSKKHITQVFPSIIHNLKRTDVRFFYLSFHSVTGSCVAVADYIPAAPDELQLSQGDTVKIEGLLIRGLAVFVATNTSTGLTGFVHKAHVKPQGTSPL